MNYLDAHGSTPDDRITVGWLRYDEGKRLWMQTRAALRAKYPAHSVVGLCRSAHRAVHTGPYALGMGVMRRGKAKLIIIKQKRGRPRAVTSSVLYLISLLNGTYSAKYTQAAVIYNGTTMHWAWCHAPWKSKLIRYKTEEDGPPAGCPFLFL